MRKYTHLDRLRGFGSLEGRNRLLRRVDEEMEMVRHQAVGQKMAVWVQQKPHFLNEKKIVISLEKYPLTVVAAVVDVVDVSGFDLHGFVLSFTSIRKKMGERDIKKRSFFSGGVYGVPHLAECGTPYTPKKNHIRSTRNRTFR